MIRLEYGRIHCFRPQDLKAFIYTPHSEPVSLILIWADRPDTVIIGEDATKCFDKLTKHYGAK